MNKWTTRNGPSGGFCRKGDRSRAWNPESPSSTSTKVNIKVHMRWNITPKVQIANDNIVGRKILLGFYDFIISRER